MNIHLNFFTDLAIVSIAIFTAISRWKHLDNTGKIFLMTMVWYFFYQLVTEGGLLYGLRDQFALFYYSVRGLQTIIEFILCIFFFQFGIRKFRKQKIARYLVPAAVFLWILSACIFRNTENFNVYFAPVACFASIILAIMGIYHLQSEYDLGQLLRLPIFQFTVLLLFFYGCYFFFLVSYPLLLKSRQAELFAVYVIFRITNVYYVGACIVYFLYPKRVMQIG